MSIHCGAVGGDDGGGGDGDGALINLKCWTIQRIFVISKHAAIETVRADSYAMTQFRASWANFLFRFCVLKTCNVHA